MFGVFSPFVFGAGGVLEHRAGGCPADQHGTLGKPAEALEPHVCAPDSAVGRLRPRTRELDCPAGWGPCLPPAPRPSSRAPRPLTPGAGPPPSRPLRSETGGRPLPPASSRGPALRGRPRAERGRPVAGTAVRRSVCHGPGGRRPGLALPVVAVRPGRPGLAAESLASLPVFSGALPVSRPGVLARSSQKDARPARGAHPSLVVREGPDRYRRPDLKLSWGTQPALTAPCASRLPCSGRPWRSREVVCV